MPAQFDVLDTGSKWAAQFSRIVHRSGQAQNDAVQGTRKFSNEATNSFCALSTVPQHNHKSHILPKSRLVRCIEP
jgi:hypothetical protein